MIDCVRCGSLFSNRSTACPHCGARIVTRTSSIKGREVAGLVVMLSGLTVYVVATNPIWIASGAALMIGAIFVALL